DDATQKGDVTVAEQLDRLQGEPRLTRRDNLLDRFRREPILQAEQPQMAVVKPRKAEADTVILRVQELIPQAEQDGQTVRRGVGQVDQRRGRRTHTLPSCSVLRKGGVFLLADERPVLGREALAVAAPKLPQQERLPQAGLPLEKEDAVRWNVGMQILEKAADVGEPTGEERLCRRTFGGSIHWYDRRVGPRAFPVSRAVAGDVDSARPGSSF